MNVPPIRPMIAIASVQAILLGIVCVIALHGSSATANKASGIAQSAGTPVTRMR